MLQRRKEKRKRERDDVERKRKGDGATVEESGVGREPTTGGGGRS
jgi:hypothetical protein